MELSAAALKRQLLKENYPQNLVLAIIDTWQLEGPKEYTQDIIAGIHYARLYRRLTRIHHQH